MQSAMVHIHITSMVDVHTLWLVALDALFNTLGENKTIQGIQAFIWKIKEFHTRYTKDRSSGFCRLNQG